MKDLKSILSSYLEECRRIFKRAQTYGPTVIPMPGVVVKKEDRSLLEKSIKEAEQTEIFDAFVVKLESEVLNHDLERLMVEKKIKKEDIIKWQKNTANHAAHRFFKNSGTYFNIWIKSDIDEPSLLSKLYNKDKESEYYQLFVFDGFVLYDNQDSRKWLKNITLPVGDLTVYRKKELKELFRLPQSNWHDFYDPVNIDELSMNHILTVKKKELYRGKVGIWLNDIMFSTIDSHEYIGNYIELIGPMFLCIGEDANLAEEICVRSNVFDTVPIYTFGKSYLSWDSIDEEGNPNPRRYINYVGNDAIILKNIYNSWLEVNNLDKNGFLRFPTETYVRSMQNLHRSNNNSMEIFVTFVTVIESVLNPGSTSDLSYKTASRGAAILSQKMRERINIFHCINNIYKTRSKIVHEGHTGKADLDGWIFHELLKLSQQIFLRYIVLISLAINNKLTNSFPFDFKQLKSKEKRPNIINELLNAVVLGTELTKILEEELNNWGMKLGPLILNHSPKDKP